MDSENRNDVRENASPIARIGGNALAVSDGHSTNTAKVAKNGFVDAAKNRRERIKKMEARLQREVARDNAATRKERNGQLFVWGAMVEGVYRDGNAQEREQLRRWARQRLTDKRHLKRAESGFARIEDEAANSMDE